MFRPPVDVGRTWDDRRMAGHGTGITRLIEDARVSVVGGQQRPQARQEGGISAAPDGAIAPT